MNSQIRRVLVDAAVAVGAGVLLRFAIDLHPLWWLVWIAPAPLLIVAFRFPLRDALGIVIGATLIAASGDFHFFSLVMPWPAAIWPVVETAALWTMLIFAARRVVVRRQAWWTVLVFPALWAAADTLMAALLADGNWGSLAYSQGDQLPVMQIASLFGTPGLVFLLMLVPSALALSIAYGRTLRRGWIAYSLTPVLVVGALVCGDLRLQKPVTGAETSFGIVSIDDPIGLRSSDAYAGNILNEYDQRIAELAREGAQVVVLPEKIAMVNTQSTGKWQRQFGAVARQNHVWLEVGVGVDDGRNPTNWAWLFSPDGTLQRVYEKHHMAPPERQAHYASGTEYAVQTVGGQTYGLAVCKDMHFASFGREYGKRGAAVMLVPAWDFDYLDGWLEARTTIVRGIENGYTIVRAAREGMLTASDPYGRVLAETPSSPMPGNTLLVRIPVAAQVPTLYTRIGNLFGWLCVIASVVFLLIGRAGANSKKAGEVIYSGVGSGLE